MSRPVSFFGSFPEAAPSGPVAVPPSEAEAWIRHIEASTGDRLYTPAQAKNPPPGLIAPPALRQVQRAMRWIEGFIMRPHLGLRRPGVVCPYVKPSLDAAIFYFSLHTLHTPDRYDEILPLMHRQADIFLQMEPRSGPLENLRVLTVLVPNGREGVLSDAAHCKRLKTEMMRRGITIGQFFPTWNPIKYLRAKFFPNQPPFCLYTMRTFIRSDWMFIQGEPEWRAVYCERFGAPPETGAGFHL